LLLNVKKPVKTQMLHLVERTPSSKYGIYQVLPENLTLNLQDYKITQQWR